MIGDATIGFDTATAVLSVASTRGGQTLFESYVDADSDGRPRHARALIGEVERAVEAAGGWERLARIGVGVGPGTFTGLRIGVATARALAQATGVPLTPVGSLDALLEPSADLPGETAALIDAKRGEVFAALRDGSGERVWGPEVIAPEALIARLGKCDRPLAIGDGSLRFRAQLEHAGARVPDPADGVHRVSAAAICRLADRGETVPLETVEPRYLRRPDAELWRERQQRERKDQDR